MQPITSDMPLVEVPQQHVSNATKHVGVSMKDMMTPTEKSHGRRTDWPSSRVILLLELYRESCTALNKGNFKKKHSDELAETLNSKCGREFATDQLKNTWDALQKTYKAERKKEQGTGAAPSTWEYYDRMSEILARTPKVHGLVRGFDGETFMEVPESNEQFEDEARDEGNQDMQDVEEEDLCQSRNTRSTPTADSYNPPTATASTKDDSLTNLPYKEAIKGQHTKKRKRSSDGGLLGNEFKEAIKYNTDAVKVCCIKAEKERLQKGLEFQMEIARMFVGHQYET
ncbi:hypothetical protein L7F22_042918 [Adiantum nelumboides]|nr:hypothetical protein [Adiantum nelumboides]